MITHQPTLLPCIQSESLGTLPGTCTAYSPNCRKRSRQPQRWSQYCSSASAQRSSQAYSPTAGSCSPSLVPLEAVTGSAVQCSQANCSLAVVVYGPAGSTQAHTDLSDSSNASRWLHTPEALLQQKPTQQALILGAAASFPDDDAAGIFQQGSAAASAVPHGIIVTAR